MHILYSVIIPVFNSTSSLYEIVDRLNYVFLHTLKIESYEIIFVDDCSQNSETWRILTKLCKKNKKIKIFRLARNFGQNNAILCGISNAQGEWLITMDDDLQHRPEDIPLLLEKCDHDIVIARFSKKKCAYFKKIASMLKGWLDNYLLGLPAHIDHTAFRVFKRRVAQDILSIRTPRPTIIALILSVTKDIINVDVAHEARKYKKSNYSIRKSFSLFSNMIFNNSSFMLRAMSVFGFILAGFSFLFGFALIIRRLMQDQPVMGWTSLMVILLISTGAIIFCLGILGEYVARLIATAESRPTWVIKESIDNVNKDI